MKKEINFEALIATKGQVKHIAKAECLFQQGDTDPNLYFVCSGLLKAYYVSSEGKESIKSFIKPGSTIGSLNAAYQGSHCSFSLVALQDSKILRIAFSELLEATHRSHKIAEEMIKTLLTHPMKKEQREYELLTLQRFPLIRKSVYNQAFPKIATVQNRASQKTSFTETGQLKLS